MTSPIDKDSNPYWYLEEIDDYAPVRGGGDPVEELVAYGKGVAIGAGIWGIAAAAAYAAPVLPGNRPCVSGG